MEELKTIETVDTSPFKHLVMTIGELPTSFVDSMTYYECLAWLVNYIQNTVIPAVNNNAEALEELQTAFTTLKNYVDNYFDNLDVQEEINNKLDQMAESGELGEVISARIVPYIDEINQEMNEFQAGINVRLADMDNEITAVASGAPAGTYATAAALASADPDHSKIYVVTADGKWYYYDTSDNQWTAGGTYMTNATDTQEELNKLHTLGFTNLDERLSEFDGIYNPNYERGTVFLHLDRAWEYLDSDTVIRTPEGEEYPVSAGDVVGLTDYTNYEYSFGTIKSDSSTTYSDWRTTDTRINPDNEGLICIRVKKRDNSDIADPAVVGSKIFIKKYSYNYKTECLDKDKDANTIVHEDFTRGTTYGGAWHAANNRVVTYSNHSFAKDVAVTNYNATFKFTVHWINPTTQAVVDSGWIRGNNASYQIPANVQFRVMVARDVEDPTEIADIDTFTSGITVYEKGTEKIETLYNPYKSCYGYLNADGTFSGSEDQVTLTTDYIPVDATGTFSLYNEVLDTTKEAWCGMALFNEDKEIIARLTWQGRTTEIGLNKVRAFVQTPATCKFIRLSFRHWAACKVQLNYGYNFGEYMPYQLAPTNRRSLAYKYNLRSIAHRGWSYAEGAPENTLPAFIQAKVHGFTFVETDVQFTSDDVPVCLHDRTVDRTTDGTGNIDSMTLAQAQALNADDGKTAYSGVQIPTFEAFIQTCRDLELIALVELKMDSVNYEDFEKYEILMNIVKKYDMQDRVCWLGSNFRRLLPIRNLDPYACVCLLTFTDTDDARLRAIDLLNNLFKNDYNRVVYSADHRKLNSTIINVCKNTDLSIDAWTLYNSTQLDALDEYVSGVTTEDVPYAKYLYDKLTEA